MPLALRTFRLSAVKYHEGLTSSEREREWLDYREIEATEIDEMTTFAKHQLNGVTEQFIEYEDDDGVEGSMYLYFCNNCGAIGRHSIDDLKHFNSCVPGEAEYWQRFYSQPSWEAAMKEIEEEDHEII